MKNKLMLVMLLGIFLIGMVIAQPISTILYNPFNNSMGLSDLVSFKANVTTNSTLYIKNTSLYIWKEDAYNQYWNTTGLVAWYQFDDNTANDYFKVNNGTNVNGAYESAIGKIGGSAVFDGVNDYVNLGTNGFGINGTTTLTVCSWFKPNGASQLIYSNILGYTDTTMAFNYRSTTTLTVCMGNGTESLQGYGCTGAISPSSNIWTFYCGTYNGTTISGYSNGAFVSSVQKSFNNGVKLTQNYIGSYDGTKRYFNGSIDDVRIYNRSLSATEISNLYNQMAEVHNSYVSQNDVFVDSVGKVGIGTTTPLNLLSIAGTGMLQLVANTTARTCNIANAGSIYYNTGTFKHYGCNSTAWKALY